MFVRDILEADIGPASGGRSSRLTPSDIVPARATRLRDVTGTLVNREGDFGLDGREAWIFISIKNRAFNRAYVDWFIDMCEATGMVGRICRVDDPYRFNRMAELGLDDLCEHETSKISRLSSDIGRMVQKALNGKRTDRVEMVDWHTIADDTPTAYHDEISRAFHGGTLVRQVLRNHIGAVKDLDSEARFERYARFFLCEVPILLHAYYRDRPVMDVYPGSQPEFFWQIEMGLFAEELPLLTALTQGNRSMLYLETTDCPGASR